MTNNKIRTKILELESPSKVKERLKIRGVRTIKVSDNAGFWASRTYILLQTHYFQIYPYCGYLPKEDGVATTDVSDNRGVDTIEVSDNSGVTTSKVINRLGRTINTKQY